MIFKPGNDVIYHGVPCQIKRISHDQLDYYLEQGWFKDACFKEVPPDEDSEEEKKLREKAKKARMRNWHNMKLETLRAKLNAN